MLFEKPLDYSNTDVSLFRSGISNSRNVKVNEILVSGDLDSLIDYLVDPNQINYLFITDFFMTYRMYTDSLEVLRQLIDRFEQCVNFSVFEVEKLEELADEAEEVEGKYNMVKKTLLRTFVVLRSWMLNYFVDDWMSQESLRRTWAEYLNSVASRIVAYHKSNMVDVMYLNLVTELKKVWINLCLNYWNQIDIKDVANVLEYTISYGGTQEVNASQCYLFPAIDPVLRNNKILEMSRAPTNNSIVKTSNSLANFRIVNEKAPGLLISKSKLFNNLTVMSPIFGSQEPVEPRKFNTTMISSNNEIKLLNFNMIEIPDKGKLITGENVEMFKDTKVNRIASPAKNPEPLLEPLLEPLVVQKSSKRKFKTMLSKWKTTFLPSKSPVIQTLTEEEDQGSDVKSVKEDSPKVDYLSVRVIEELDYLANIESKSPKKTLEQSFLSQLTVLRHNSLSRLDQESSSLEWETDMESPKKVNRISFISVAEIDWNNESLNVVDSPQDDHSDGNSGSNILDITPSMIINTSDFDDSNLEQECTISRFSGTLGLLNRFSRTSLGSKQSCMTYDSEFSLAHKNLKPGVLEKVKSFEKMRVAYEQSKHLKGKKSFKNLRQMLDLDTKIKSKVDFFQPGALKVPSVSTRKDSLVQSSLFSENHTQDTFTSSNTELSDVKEQKQTHDLTGLLNKQISHLSVLTTPPRNVDSNCVRRNTLDSDQLLQTVLDVDSVDISMTKHADYTPLHVENLSRDKSHISMLSVQSYLLPGLDQEIVDRLAAIPDETFDGNDPVLAALFKLEGKQGDEDDHELRRKVRGPADSWGLRSKRLLGNQILETEARRPIEEQVDVLNINKSIATPDWSPQYMTLPMKEESIFSTVPAIIQRLDKTKIAEVFETQQPDVELEQVMALRAHISFMLQYDARNLAEQFTLIERDCLLEIDWKELVEMNGQLLDPFGSWVEVLAHHEIKGIELAVARFNLTINWIISEILLTNDFQARLATIVKFIDVAEHCNQLQNYSTMIQIILALSSEKIANLPSTWENLDTTYSSKFKVLEEFVNPMNDFETIKRINEDAVASKGTIPFIGLYLSELQSNFLRPDHVTAKSCKKYIKGQVLTVKGKPLGLIFWEKFYNISLITKRIIEKIQYSKFYEIETDRELISKCLYIKALSPEEMSLCSGIMDEP